MNFEFDVELKDRSASATMQKQIKINTRIFISLNSEKFIGCGDLRYISKWSLEKNIRRKILFFSLFRILYYLPSINCSSDSYFLNFRMDSYQLLRTSPFGSSDSYSAQSPIK